jgi:DNA polymerase-1
MEAADQRGFIFNWLGRRCYYPEYYDSEREEWTKGVYRAPNHLIQGGCGDVVKVAMNRVDDYLMDKKSKLILQVHDELMIEIDRSEEFIIPVVKKIMETAYPYKHIPLTVDFSRAEKSWADKVKDAA